MSRSSLRSPLRAALHGAGLAIGLSFALMVLAGMWVGHRIESATFEADPVRAESARAIWRWLAAAYVPALLPASAALGAAVGALGNFRERHGDRNDEAVASPDGRAIPPWQAAMSGAGGGVMTAGVVAVLARDDPAGIFHEWEFAVIAVVATIAAAVGAAVGLSVRVVLTRRPVGVDGTALAGAVLAITAATVSHFLIFQSADGGGGANPFAGLGVLQDYVLVTLPVSGFVGLAAGAVLGRVKRGPG